MIFEQTPQRIGRDEHDQQNVSSWQRNTNTTTTTTSGGRGDDDDDASPYASHSMRFADYFPGQTPDDKMESHHHPHNRSAATPIGDRVLFDSSSHGGDQLPTVVEHSVRSVVSPNRSSEYSHVQHQNMQLTRHSPRSSTINHDSEAVYALQQQILEVSRQRDALHVVVQELRDRQQAIVRKESGCDAREAALNQREKDTSAQVERLAAVKAEDLALEYQRRLDEEAATTRRDLRQAQEDMETQRAQLRDLNRELNNRESEIESIMADLAREREALANQKLQMERREVIVSNEEDEITKDVQRHAEKLQASSRAMEDRLRDMEKREREVQRVQYEWELKWADLVRREQDVSKRETAVRESEVMLENFFVKARHLEFQAVVLQRAEERIRERESLVWQAASSAAPHMPRALASIRDDLRIAKSSIQSLGSHLPAMLAKSSSA